MSLEPISIGLTLASTALSAVQGISQANAQAAQADYQAQVAQIQAEQARRRGSAEANVKRRQARRQLAKQRAAVGRSGVALAGTPLNVLGDLAAEGELSALDARQKRLVQAANFTNTAKLKSFQADAARQSGYLGVGQSLLSGLNEIPLDDILET